MKSINVNWEVDSYEGYEKVTFEDLGITYKEFCRLGCLEQQILVQQFLDNLPKRVEILLDNFTVNID